MSIHNIKTTTQIIEKCSNCGQREYVFGSRNVTPKNLTNGDVLNLGRRICDFDEEWNSRQSREYKKIELKNPEYVFGLVDIIFSYMEGLNK